MAPRPKLKDLPLLSPSEWRVFSVLARRTEATVRQLEADLQAEATPDEEPMSYAMLQTLVRRLEAKGYAGSRPMPGTTAHLFQVVYPFDEVLRRQATQALTSLALGTGRCS